MLSFGGVVVLLVSRKIKDGSEGSAPGYFGLR